MNRLRVSVIMPARNEESSVARVLDDIPRALVDEIIVADNGSSDGTAEIARARGATVVQEPKAGYGRACLAALARADGNTDVIVVLDADYSDFPEDLPALLAPIAAGDADFVIGSRMRGGAESGALPWNQRFGNQLACRMFLLLYGASFTDIGPFRAIRRDSLAQLGMRDPTYGWNVEMQAKAIIAGLRIREVPVRYRRRIGQSKISGTVGGTIRAGTRIIATILMYYPSYLKSGRVRKS